MYRNAGFFERFFAILIDGVILLFTYFIITLMFLPFMASKTRITSDMLEQASDIEIFKMFPFFFSTIIVVTIFYSCFFLHMCGATPGKMALSIKIIDENTGENISVLKAFCREFLAKYLSQFLLIGYLIAAFREDNKALHDLICSTRVVKN